MLHLRVEDNSIAVDCQNQLNCLVKKILKKKSRVSPKDDTTCLGTEVLTLADDSLCKSKDMGLTDELEGDENHFDNPPTHDCSHTFNSM